MTWLIASIVGHTLVCFVVGYMVGSGRTFASLSYFDEGWRSMLQTMLPGYGVPKWLRDRRAGR